jgi:uncharacterized protein (DUF58 family)
MEQKLVDSTLLKKLETLKLNSNVILNNGYSGGRKSKSKGSSVEFSDFREYVSGDDFKKIDWNAYGRFEKLFIKLFMEEREANINIFLDASKSMDFGSPKKAFIGKQIALALGYLSLSNLDRVSAFNQNNDTLDSLGPINGKKSLSSLVDYLDRINCEQKSDMINAIKSRPYKRGISIIISDLFSDSFEEIIKYLSYMNQSIVVIQVLCTEELQPKFTGDVRLIDSETDEAKDISMASSVIRAYEKTLNSFFSKIKEICRKYGCYYTLISNETSIESIVFDNLIKAGILR